MGAGLFWGVLLIIIGLGIVIRVVFNIDFPIFKFLIAFFFIYIGIKILFGKKLFNSDFKETDIVFSEQVIRDDFHDKEYNVLFGKGTFDLRNIDFQEQNVRLKINTVFGAAEILVDEDIPMEVKADAVFAGVSLPKGNSAAFGSARYESDSLEKTKPYLYIKADAVFGAIEFKRE